MKLTRNIERRRWSRTASLTAMRWVVAAILGVAGTGAFAQGDPGAVAGLLLDPGGAVLPGVEVVLTGIEVGATHTARTDGEGRYDFPAVAPGDYRVEVRQPGVVPVSDTMAVAADERLEANIATTLRMRIGMELRAVSAEAVRQWVAGGPPPERPVEWECTWSGGACAAPAAGRQAGRVDAFPAEPVVFPSLVQQVPDELALQAFVALDGRQGSVQIRDMIGTDGFPNGLRVSSATSPELAAAALTAVGQMRWEPARLRGAPVDTSMTMAIRFNPAGS